VYRLTDQPDRSVLLSPGPAVVVQPGSAPG